MLLILTIIPLLVFFSNSLSSYEIPVLANQYNNTLVLEIRDKNMRNGNIYFVPPGTTANQLLAMTGSNPRIAEDFLLESGMNLVIDSCSENKVLLSAIDNSHRFALGMPLDLNTATIDDLLLIPGIGEITAQKILELRSKKTHFNNIEELMEIKGIKEKKLDGFKQYLCLQK